MGNNISLECFYSPPPPPPSPCFLLVVFSEKDNRIEHTNYNIYVTMSSTVTSSLQ
jgi:hypothetical protein